MDTSNPERTTGSGNLNAVFQFTVSKSVIHYDNIT